MNLSEAYKITSDASYAVSQAMAAAQLLLSRKKQEREARMVRYEQIVTIMEAESNAADAEIEALEKLIFGEPKVAEAKPLDPDAETEVATADFEQLLREPARLMINRHAQEAEG